VNVPEYDLVVIGSGPAGQKGAIAAAKGAQESRRDRRERNDRRGVSVHTGTIPSKSVREAIFPAHRLFRKDPVRR